MCEPFKRSSGQSLALKEREILNLPKNKPIKQHVQQKYHKSENNHVKRTILPQIRHQYAITAYLDVESFRKIIHNLILQIIINIIYI